MTDPGLASCGHAADADGECNCAYWPERAPFVMPDNQPVIKANITCNGCRGAAYWDGQNQQWQHANIADALFCNIFRVAVDQAAERAAASAPEPLMCHYCDVEPATTGNYCGECAPAVALAERALMDARHAAERALMDARHASELAEFDAANPDAMRPLGQ